jgi:hypothetical protein
MLGLGAGAGTGTGAGAGAGAAQTIATTAASNTSWKTEHTSKC